MKYQKTVNLVEKYILKNWDKARIKEDYRNNGVITINLIFDDVPADGFNLMFKTLQLWVTIETDYYNHGKHGIRIDFTESFLPPYGKGSILFFEEDEKEKRTYEGGRWLKYIPTYNKVLESALKEV